MVRAFLKAQIFAVPLAQSGRRLIAFVMGLLALTGVAIAYQVNISSSGTGPVVKTYPSTLTATYTITGSNSSINQPSVALNGFGLVTSTQLSPTISASTDAIRARITAPGCTLAMGRCSNVGTLTIAFNKPVTNPVLHISGLGGVVTGSGTNSFFSAAMVLTGSSGTLSTPSLSFLNGTSNFQVSGGNEIRTPTINGAVNCNVTPTAGCGSVRVNGTVSSLTFRLDLLMGGTTDPSAAGAESFTITTSVDEDFGDAPSAYQASPVASHIVGGVRMGATISADNTNTVNGNPQATSPVANASASGDTSGDDGVTFPLLVRGVTGALINVSVTGTGGRLQGWIDWGADNSFATSGDQIATNAIDGGSGDNDGVANGVIQLSVNPPAGTAQTTTRARFRYSTTASLGINGVASDGEVEDYEVILYPQRNDLSLTKGVSNASPSPGAAISYTLTLTSAALSPTSNTTTTGVTVQDTLPAGFTYTGVAPGGTGTYDNGTGIWTVGSMAPGAIASITINGTATGTASTTVTNIAQVRASSITDPDSTPNNGVTSEDDYATISFTTTAVYNCPTGSTSTGSGFATGGTGAFQNQIFWLDWSCGGTASFPVGSVINKSWNAGDGLVITGQVTNITGVPIESYSTGGWSGDRLDNMYPGVNPIGLGGAGGNDPNYRVAYSATLNGTPVPLRYAVADAEDTGTSGSEIMSVTTTGSAWSLVEEDGDLVPVLSGTTASWTGTLGSDNGSLIVETSGTNVTIDASSVNQGGEFFAFGVFTPFDFSDAPLTGTSYASANHRVIGSFDLGPGVTTEAAAYDSPTASADANDDGVTFPTLTPTVSSTLSVAAPNFGYLSAWIDWNNDGDFADAGEQVATDFVNGGTGDTDGTANGVITFSITPPSGVTQAFARFRLSSRTGAPSSGLHGFGEIEDYQIIITPLATLTLTKTSETWDDGINPVFNLPGNDVMYTLLISNTTAGQPDTDTVFLYDTLPAEVTFYNGDADGAGPGTTAVLFTDSGSGLTFSYATDVRYSNVAAPPASFGDCTYTPAAGYDANVKHVCVNPKGIMNGKTGAPTPSFTLKFRAKIQ